MIGARDITLLASIFKRITSKLLPLPSKVAALEGNSFDRSSDFTFAINYCSSCSVTVKLPFCFESAQCHVIASKMILLTIVPLGSPSLFFKGEFRAEIL
jgi:hypothetical protein